MCNPLEFAESICVGVSLELLKLDWEFLILSMLWPGLGEQVFLSMMC